MATSNLKPIKAYGAAGPNPPKVISILEELGLPYEVQAVAITDVKKPEYTAINPNGRLPAIYDPNTDLTLWESGAILEYLVETYDKEGKISFPKGSKESFITKQWLFFQATGQGPYFGQAVWFTRYHPEQLPSARERYIKEILRVTGVVEGHLAKQDAAKGPWLVGDRVTYADIAWFMWQDGITLLPEVSYDNYPNVKKWLDNLRERPAVAKAVEINKANSHPVNPADLNK
ncbi:glutathione S-transferase [Astrocystis sublimbata]|nr:glutathione S-transferase [Astrocystis sublimbata]